MRFFYLPKEYAQKLDSILEHYTSDTGDHVSHLSVLCGCIDAAFTAVCFTREEFTNDN